MPHMQAVPGILEGYCAKRRGFFFLPFWHSVWGASTSRIWHRAHAPMAECRVKVSKGSHVYYQHYYYGRQTLALFPNFGSLPRRARPRARGTRINYLKKSYFVSFFLFFFSYYSLKKYFLNWCLAGFYLLEREIIY